MKIILLFLACVIISIVHVTAHDRNCDATGTDFWNPSTFICGIIISIVNGVAWWYFIKFIVEH